MGIVVSLPATSAVFAAVIMFLERWADTIADTVILRLPQNHIAVDNAAKTNHIVSRERVERLKTVLRPSLEAGLRFVGLQASIVLLGNYFSSAGSPMFLHFFHWLFFGPLLFYSTRMGLLFHRWRVLGLLLAFCSYVSFTVLFYLFAGDAGRKCSFAEAVVVLWIRTGFFFKVKLATFGVMATFLPLGITGLASKAKTSMPYFSLLASIALGSFAFVLATNSGMTYSVEIVETAQSKGYCGADASSTLNAPRETVNPWLSFWAHVILIGCYAAVLAPYRAAATMLAKLARLLLEHHWPSEPAFAPQRGWAVAWPKELAAIPQGAKMTLAKVLRAWRSAERLWSLVWSWAPIESMLLQSLVAYSRFDDLFGVIPEMLSFSKGALLSARCLQWTAVTTVACEPDRETVLTAPNALSFGRIELRLTSYTRRSTFNGMIPLPKILWQRRPVLSIGVQDHSGFDVIAALKKTTTNTQQLESPIRIPVVITTRVYTAAVNRALQRRLAAPSLLAATHTVAADHSLLNRVLAFAGLPGGSLTTLLPRLAANWREHLNHPPPQMMSTSPQQHARSLDDLFGGAGTAAAVAAVAAREGARGGPGRRRRRASSAGEARGLFGDLIAGLDDRGGLAMGDDDDDGFEDEGELEEEEVEETEAAAAAEDEAEEDDELYGVNGGRVNDGATLVAPSELDFPDDSSVAEEDQERDVWECCQQEEEGNGASSLHLARQVFDRSSSRHVPAGVGAHRAGPMANNGIFEGQRLPTDTGAVIGDRAMLPPQPNALPAAALQQPRPSFFSSVFPALAKATVTATEMARAVWQGRRPIVRANAAAGFVGEGGMEDAIDRPSWMRHALALISAGAKDDGKRLLGMAVDASTVIVSSLLGGLTRRSGPASLAGAAGRQRQSVVKGFFSSLFSPTSLLSRTRKMLGQRVPEDGEGYDKAGLWASLLERLHRDSRGSLVELEVVLSGSEEDSPRLRFPLLRYGSSVGLGGPLLSENTLATSLGNFLLSVETGRKEEMAEIIEQTRREAAAGFIDTAIPVGPSFISKGLLPLLRKSCGGGGSSSARPCNSCTKAIDEAKNLFPSLLLPSTASSSPCELRPRLLTSLEAALRSTSDRYTSTVIDKASNVLRLTNQSYHRCCKKEGDDEKEHQPTHLVLFKSYEDAMSSLLQLYNAENAYFGRLIKATKEGMTASADRQTAGEGSDDGDDIASQNGDSAGAGAARSPAAASPPVVAPASPMDALMALLGDFLLRRARRGTSANAQEEEERDEVRNFFNVLLQPFSSAMASFLWHHNRHRLSEVCLIDLLQCVSVSYVTLLLREQERPPPPQAQASGLGRDDGDDSNQRRPPRRAVQAALAAQGGGSGAGTSAAATSASGGSANTDSRPPGTALRRRNRAAAAATASSEGPQGNQEREQGERSDEPAADDDDIDIIDTSGPTLDPSKATAPELLARLVALASAVAANRIYTGERHS
jgi:hypothetical protein